MDAVTPWQIIEEALARLRPPRNKEWLSVELTARGREITPQGVGNWKKRGVPGNRFIELGEILGLEPRQVAGLDPLPWDGEERWPFPDRALLHRVERLQPEQLRKAQEALRQALDAIELGGRPAAPAATHQPPTPSQAARGTARLSKKMTPLEPASRRVSKPKGTRHG